MSRTVSGLLLFGACACAQTPAPESALPPASVRSEAPPAHAHGASVAEAAAKARLFSDFGSYARPPGAANAEAQPYFDQGLRLYYAFHHDEAFRSFAKALELDPRCALCFFGASLALGPNYNMPMFADRAEVAFRLRERALELAPASDPTTQALIAALAVRYRAPNLPALEVQAEWNEGYARAMGTAAERFPDDPDVQTLYAEALMDLNPWKLWSPDGKPAKDADQIVATLEKVLAQMPDHPGANHLYIHAVEASKTPERALGAAKQVAGLMPLAGHLVHMPAHIYQRVGQYADAAEANRRAAEADARYAAETDASAHYVGMYSSHNYQFLAYSAAAEGRLSEALEAARKGATLGTPDALRAMPWMEFFMAQPWVLAARFGAFSDALAAAEPPVAFAVAHGLWQHARGVAFSATGKPAAAQAALAALQAERKALPPNAAASLNTGADILEIAEYVLSARIAYDARDLRGALAQLEQGLRKEDQLAYDEPPNWWFPLRPVMGGLLLEARQFERAERIYRADLERHPNNGWSYFGLAEALRQRGKRKDAAQALSAHQTAWARADGPLITTGFPTKNKPILRERTAR